MRNRETGLVIGLQRDSLSGPFFDAADRDELLLRQCRSCRHILAPDRVSCTKCASHDLDWFTASGSATLVSWAVHHALASLSDPDQPAVLATVELVEGPWLQLQLIDNDGSGLAVGDPLAVEFVTPDRGERFPVVRRRVD
jgi:uncharacterized OB-fold protein